MEIKLKKYHNICIIFPAGELDLYNAPELERIFNNMITKGFKAFVLDLGNVNYIDSSGVGLLLKLKSTAEKKKIDYLMSTIEGEVLNVLRLTNLIQFFPIEADFQKAVKKLLKSISLVNGAKIND